MELNSIAPTAAALHLPVLPLRSSAIVKGSLLRHQQSDATFVGRLTASHKRERREYGSVGSVYAPLRSVESSLSLCRALIVPDDRGRMTTTRDSSESSKTETPGLKRDRDCHVTSTRASRQGLEKDGVFAVGRRCNPRIS